MVEVVRRNVTGRRSLIGVMQERRLRTGAVGRLTDAAAVQARRWAGDARVTSPKGLRASATDAARCAALAAALCATNGVLELDACRAGREALPAVGVKRSRRHAAPARHCWFNAARMVEVTRPPARFPADERRPRHGGAIGPGRLSSGCWEWIISTPSPIPVKARRYGFPSLAGPSPPNLSTIRKTCPSDRPHTNR
jgi:hypothetical protein